MDPYLMTLNNNWLFIMFLDSISNSTPHDTSYNFSYLKTQLGETISCRFFISFDYEHELMFKPNLMFNILVLFHKLHQYHFGFSESGFTKGRKSKHLVDLRPEIKTKIITLLCLLVKVNPKVNVHSKERVINPFSPFEWCTATAHSKRGITEANWSAMQWIKSHGENDLPYSQDIFSLILGSLGNQL